MSLVNGLKRKVNKYKMMFKDGVYIEIHTEKLKQDVEFVLFNLPKNLVKGIEIIEEIFDVEAQSHQIIVKATMTTIDVKRQIGKYVFREKRWIKQEDITRKLFAEEKVDLDMFYEIYETKDYLKVYENVCMDVFAVFYGNESMSLDEISVAINSLYIKNLTDKKISQHQQEKLENFVDELFGND